MTTRDYFLYLFWHIKRRVNSCLEHHEHLHRLATGLLVLVCFGAVAVGIAILATIYRLAPIAFVIIFALIIAYVIGALARS